MSHPEEHPELSLADVTVTAGSLVSRLPMIGLGAAVAGLAGLAALGASQPERLAFSWLVAFLFFLSIPLGGLFFVMVLFATKAGWGVAVRRLSENAMATLPVFALLFLPVAWGAPHLFSWWAGPGHDELLHAKEPYLNPGFFMVRAGVYFAVWALLALWFSSRSTRQDASRDQAITRRLQAVSGPGLVLFAITVTFAAIDWIMALDPHWYSTMFGVYYFSGCLVGIFAFLILVSVALQSAGYLRHTVGLAHYHDLGKLLFAFVVFWSYIAFSQYFLIWYGNIPEETIWFRHRMEGGWQSVSLLLAVGHFALPFLFLMSRFIKQRPRLLVLGAVWMLLMHLADIYWCVMPTLDHHGPHPGLLDLSALLAVGGVFLAAYGWTLRRRALVPVGDPRLPESLGSGI